MRKLTLDPDSLRVQSFTADSQDALLRGTVAAHASNGDSACSQAGDPTCLSADSGGPACPVSFDVAHCRFSAWDTACEN